MSGSAGSAAAVIGIVLAGGRSVRFGADKLAAIVDGSPLLERAIGALAVVCERVLVVVPPDGRSDLPAGAVAIADPEPFGGPLVGLLAGLEAADRAAAAIVVAGDMPWLEPAVLRLLAEELLAAPDLEAAALEAADGSGRAERLPLALRVGPATAVARRRVAAGDRRLALLAEGLAVRVVPATRWRALDPAGRTPADVDRPEDLRSGNASD